MWSVPLRVTACCVRPTAKRKRHLIPTAVNVVTRTRTRHARALDSHRRAATSARPHRTRPRGHSSNDHFRFAARTLTLASSPRQHRLSSTSRKALATTLIIISSSSSNSTTAAFARRMARRRPSFLPIRSRTHLAKWFALCYAATSVPSAKNRATTRTQSNTVPKRNVSRRRARSLSASTTSNNNEQPGRSNRTSHQHFSLSL